MLLMASNSLFQQNWKRNGTSFLFFFFRGTVKWKFVPWNPGLMLTGILSNNSRQEFLFDTTLITLPHSTNNATKQDFQQKTLFRSIEFLKSQINKTQLTFFSQLSFLLPFFLHQVSKLLNEDSKLKFPTWWNTKSPKTAKA